MILVGDIGGTHSRLCIITQASGARHRLAEGTYSNRGFTGLAQVVQAFLSLHPQLVPQSACFCVAGPVQNAKAQLTNLPWLLEAEALRSALNLDHVLLLNDLQATAHAVPHLLPQERLVIQPGRPQARAPIAVIAPGTGLGQAFLVWCENSYRAFASEGGHADFAPQNPEQLGLWQFITNKWGHASYERVCSGSALPDVYEHLRRQSPLAESPDLAKGMRDSADQAALILRAALNQAKADPLAAAAVQLQVDIWASEAGNMALRLMAQGGVYLAGGMPNRVLPWLQAPEFISRFADKGRFSELLRDIPIHLLLGDSALLGASIAALVPPT